VAPGSEITMQPDQEQNAFWSKNQMLPWQNLSLIQEDAAVFED